MCDSQRNILSIAVLASLCIYGSVNSSTVNTNAEDQTSAAKSCCRTKHHQQTPQAGLEHSTLSLLPKTVPVSSAFFKVMRSLIEREKTSNSGTQKYLNYFELL